MSTQLNFSQCRSDWRTPRPDLVPPFIGQIIQNPLNINRQQRICNDPPRRFDKMPQRYGSGTPTLNSTVVNVAGIGKGEHTKNDTFNTMEGSVKVPVHFQQSFFTPSLQSIDILTHTSDTRLAPNPPRYYR